MSRQHWKVSLLETLSNTFIGLLVAVPLWLLIQASGYYNIHTSVIQGLQIQSLFVLASIIRGFALRRFYNWQHQQLERLVND